MPMITRLFNAAFKCPYFILTALGTISFLALAFALTSQYVFGLYPCEFCLYQRIPYAVVIALSIFGLMATKMMGRQYGAFNIALCAIAYLINSAIAFYHVGIEQNWWASGCAMPDFSGLSPDQIRNAIASAPAVSCSEAAWTLFGISMAGYNVIICMGLGVYALIANHTVKQAKRGKSRECHTNDKTN